MNVEPALQFVLYSEDRADAAKDFPVLREVLLGMLKYVCPAVKTNHVLCLPIQTGKTRICGSFWKERDSERPGSQELRRTLIRAVATEIKRGRVVFFHVDADAVYADRNACENARIHWPRFRGDVTTVLGSFDGIDAVLIPAMPYYEMESWAFANVKHLQRILSDRGDLEQLARWADDLRVLDEVADVKDTLTIADSHNQALLQVKHGFSPEALMAADKSYARTVEHLQGSRVVIDGLAAAAARPF